MGYLTSWTDSVHQRYPLQLLFSNQANQVEYQAWKNLNSPSCYMDTNRLSHAQKQQRIRYQLLNSVQEFNLGSVSWSN